MSGSRARHRPLIVSHAKQIVAAPRRNARWLEGIFNPAGKAGPTLPLQGDTPWPSADA